MKAAQDLAALSSLAEVQQGLVGLQAIEATIKDSSHASPGQICSQSKADATTRPYVQVLGQALLPGQKQGLTSVSHAGVGAYGLVGSVGCACQAPLGSPGSGRIVEPGLARLPQSLGRFSMIASGNEIFAHISTPLYRVP
jgi:hypothetical protein